MQIRKQYRFEACHVVRKCNSERCKKSFHGHSYVVEIFFESDILTDYGMILDFGDLKKNGVAKLIDKLDHSWHFWTQEEEPVKDFIKTWNQRWIEFGFNPTAENYALFLCKAVNKLIGGFKAFKEGSNNGECDNPRVYCSKVIVHETATGYAEATIEDAYDIEQESVMICSPATENS